MAMNVKRVQTLFISSANRTQGSINDFKVNLNNSLVKADDNTENIRMSVIHLSINRSWYTVRYQINDYFEIWNESLGSKASYNIPEGYYTVYSLLDCLQNMLGPSWSFTYRETDNRYSIIAPQLGLFEYRFNFVNCGHLFGDDNRLTDPFNNYISPKPILMNQDTSILIHTDIPRKRMGSLHNLDSPLFRECDVIAAIPNKTAPFDNLQIDTSNQFVFYLSVKELSSFRLWVTDQLNRPLDIHHDWTIALKFEFIEQDVVDQTVELLKEIRDSLKYIALHPKLQ
jgi:hypothetical protein